MRSHKWLCNRMPAAMAQLSAIQTFVHHLKTKWMPMEHIHRLPCILYRRIDLIGRKVCRDWYCRRSIGATLWRTFPAGCCRRKLAAKIRVWLVCLLPPYARWYRLWPSKLVRNTNGITDLLETNFSRKLHWIVHRRLNSFNRITCDSWSRWGFRFSIMQHPIGCVDAAEGTQYCCVGRLLRWHDRFGHWIIMLGHFNREIWMDVSILCVWHCVHRVVHCFCK